jgi:hypothetical protein
MLINKWLITDTIKEYNQAGDPAGICLYISANPSGICSLYKSVQSMSAEVPFTLLFSGKSFNDISKYDSCVNDVLGLFFLPSYYLTNYQPVVFLQNKCHSAIDFLDKLNEKCKKQGIRNILIKEINDNSGSFEKFTYLLDNSGFDPGAELKKWINENVKGNSPPEINLLVPAGKEKIIDDLTELQNKLKETEEYQIADILYKKQQLIDESNHQLYLKGINEKNIRFYLSSQKEERTNGLKWYYYEYEILPTWYKQFGHIIKVIMGKRSFRSLFNDNVKKYKD